ncbi:DUF305 domain-containing protein [Paucibacter sp. O1-1]|nr:DUF305 domain-containing protein [Paucibacter sp. O1-1]MDA3824745.1 DUF305 domain-containing protein [Paucibacter sp. O1-1]
MEFLSARYWGSSSVFQGVAFCLIATLAQAQPAMPHAASMPQGQMQKTPMHTSASGPHDMRQSMMSGMESMQKMPMSGDVDKDFAMMMKVHHQQAVDIAEMELAHGKSPAMKDMAKKIIAAQKKEIATFDQWLSKQK